MKALYATVTRRALTLVVFETVLIILAVAVGVWLRSGSDTWTVLTVEGGLGKALLIAAICQT